MPPRERVKIRCVATTGRNPKTKRVGKKTREAACAADRAGSAATCGNHPEDHRAASIESRTRVPDLSSRLESRLLVHRETARRITRRKRMRLSDDSNRLTRSKTNATLHRRVKSSDRALERARENESSRSRAQRSDLKFRPR